jgi:hypothetical protein
MRPPRCAQAFDATRPGAFPPAAAWLTGEEEAVWGLNLHAIDLRNVSNVRDCVQCACAYYAQHNAGAGREAASQAPQPGGGVQCCPDKCVLRSALALRLNNASH